MKKTLSILLALVLCLALFSASAENAPVTVSVWHTWGAGVGLDALNAAVEQFNQTIGQEKGIVVDINYTASRSSGNTQTMEKLMGAIATGDVPDIALLDNFQVASWAAQNALMPLDEAMAKAGFTLDEMYAWAQEGSVYKGKTYSIPYNGDVRILAVNMDLFEKAGLTEADIPRTIADIEAVAEKLTIEDNVGGFEQVGFIPWAGAGRPIYTWGWAFGGDFYDAEKNEVTVNRPEIIEAVQWEHDFAAKFGLTKFVEFANGAMAGSGATDPFISGKVAMIVYRNDQIATIGTYAPDMHYVTTVIPTKDPEHVTTWAGGWGWTLPRGAKNVDAAMEFLKYISSEEAQMTIFSTEGYSSLAVLPSVSEAVFKDREDFKSVLEVLPVAKIRPSIPVGQMLWDNLGTVLDNVLYEKDTPENQLNQLYKDINDELSMY